MTLRLNGSSSGYVEIDAPAVAGNNTLSLPSGNGSNRQAVIGDGAGSLSFAWDAGSLFYRLNSDVAGANVSTAQSVFGVGVTLAASTVYYFESAIILTKTAGTTSHNVQTLFAMTGTVNNILFTVQGTHDGAATLPTVISSGTNSIRTAMNNSVTTALDATGNITTTSIVVSILMKGTISVGTTPGTFTPQYKLTAAPGAAYTTAAGSYIRLVPIGAAGSNSSQGTWA